MTDDLDLDVDLEDVERLEEEDNEPNLSASRFLDDFEETLKSGDPFRLIQRVARSDGKILSSSDPDLQSGLHTLSDSADQMMQLMGSRVVHSALSVQQPRPLQISGVDSSRLASFISRAQVSDYQLLFQRPGEFKATFFQFQEESVVSTLLQRTDPTTLLTQRAAFTSSQADKTTAEILLGNELTYAAGRALNRSTHQILGIQAYASFHPKVGYVGDLQRGLTAFIGTQNITPALQGNNSLETLMTFRYSAREAVTTTPMATLERSIAKEIYQLTGSLTKFAQQTAVYRPGQFRQYLAQKQVQRNFLYVEQEIQQRITQALTAAAFEAQTDQVVVSMGEISLLLSQSQNTPLHQAIAQLAKERRLSIITDNKRLNNFFDDLRTDPSRAVNQSLINLLIQTGSLKVATTGYQHDKTIAIFGEQNQLRFLNVGSANFSADSLTAVRDLGTRREYFDEALAILKRQSVPFDDQAPLNLDVNLILGSGIYQDRQRLVLDAQPYLDSLSSKLYQHYTNLSAGWLQSRVFYKSGYLAEQHADPTKVEQLRQSLEQLNQEIGGLLDIYGRYSIDQGQAIQTGLSVKVRALGSSSVQTTLSLTADRYGNVILPELNKLIPGAIFLNKSVQTRQVAGRTVSPGASVQLSGIETAVGLVATLSRELSYQAKFGIVDTLFERLGTTHYHSLKAASRNLLAKVLQASNEELRQKPALNLTTVLSTLVQQEPEVFGSTLSKAQQLLTLTDPSLPLSDKEKLERFNTLKPVFSEFLEPINWDFGDVDDQAAKRLLSVLSVDNKGLLTDIKLSLILSLDEGKRLYQSVQNTQARRLVQDLTAPFLAAHELNYSAMQAQARLPIYGETEVYDTSTAYGKVLNAGFLNPALVKPGTRVGQPGQYFRPVGATSHAKTLILPGFGNIRQLNVIDSDISTGATVAYDVQKLFTSTSGLAQIQKDQYIAQMRQVFTNIGSDATLVDLEDVFYLLPFTKAEQIPQRLKNVVGSRPALDVNPDLVKKIKTLQPFEGSPTSFLSGRLREVLPHAQFTELAAKAKHQDFASLQDYYRSLELDPLNPQRGFIGPRAMKRVAIIGGTSLIGDSSYLNAGYDLYVGDHQRITVKVLSRQVINQLETQALLSKYLAPGNILFSTPVALDDVESTVLLSSLRQQLQATDQPITVSTLQKALESSQEGKYRDVFVKQQGSKYQFFYREGLYSQTENGYRRIGAFNEDGLITVNGLGTQQTTHWGNRHQPITLKFQVFNKRHQSGVAVITGTPTIQVATTGTMTISTDVLTMWEPGTGSRPVGSGLVKGPFSVIKSEIFQEIDELVSKRTKLKPQALAQETLYGLFGQGHFKGFNYETGLYLLSQQDTRRTLTELSGEQIARNLSLLFLGDAEVKTALRDQLNSSGLNLVADAISQVKATDFAEVKNGKPSSFLGQTALGLTSLSTLPGAAEDAAKGSLASVKQTVVKALRNDPQAIKSLETQTKKLINAVLTSPESAIQFATGEVILNESNLLTRGAGLLAHLSFIGQQLFSQSLAPGQSIGKLYERDLSNVQKYLSDVAYRNVVDTVAATAGLRLPSPQPENTQQLQRKLSLLQSMIQNDVLLEDIKDITVSRSLVPTGMKDEAVMEYQYLLGMSSSYLKRFSKVGGGSQASQELQTAFARLLGSFRVDLPASNAQLGYRLALPGEHSSAFFSTVAEDTQALLLSYTQLGERLGLVEQAIDEVSTSKGAVALRRLQRFQRLVTGMTADGASHLEARAIAANKLFNVAYFSDQAPKDSKAAKLQVAHLKKTLNIKDTFAPQESALSITTQIVRKAYISYQEDRFFRQQDGQVPISFQEFVSQGFAGRVSQKLEEQYKLITELAGEAHRIPGVPLSDNTDLLDAKIAQRIQKINQRTLNAIESTYQTSIYKEFVQASLNLESQLQSRASESERSKQLLQELQITKQVILPQFTAEPITQGELAGRYRLSLLDPGEYEPTVGLMMGTDILRRAPLLFPQYTDEALRYQVELRQKLLETRSLRERLLTPGSTVSEKQLRQLQELQEVLDASRVSTVRLLDTDFTRKVMGDRQQFEGTVGIAIGSFALDATETTLGQRYSALGSSRNNLAVVENQFRLIQMALQKSNTVNVQQILSDTFELTRALGYRTNEAEVTQQFESALKVAKTQMLTQQQVANLKLQTLSAIANIPIERISQTSPTELNKLINLSSGSIRRGGAPAGSAALTAESNFYDVLDPQSLQARLAQEGSGLIPETERFKTGMLVPAIGRLLAMLGDFDGDAYQFLLSGVGDHASRLSELQKQTLQLGQRLDFLDRQINRTNTQELQQQRQQLQNQFDQLNQQLSQEIAKVTQFSNNVDRLQNKALKDMRKWVGAYLALPDFVTDEQSSISTGTLMSMVQQMSGTMPQIEDAAPHIRRIEEQLNGLTATFGTATTPEQFDPNNPTTRKKIDQLVEQNRSLSTSVVEGVLRYANQQQSFTPEAFEASARTYLAFQSNLSMTFEQVNKSMKKASGILLNPFDLEGLQGVIGQAGTELIGKTYNVLVPMIDQVMLEQAFVSGLQTTGQSSFRTVIDQNLKAMAQEASIEESVEIQRLRRKLLSPDQDGFSQHLSSRFSAVTGTLASLQQIIRDALKEKSDKGIINVLREASFEGKPLAEALETVQANSPLEADKERTQILKQAVMSRIGPSLNIGSDPQDYGITGFGALLKLADYSMTDSDDELYKKFIADPGLEKSYYEQIRQGNVSNVSEFAASQVISLVEKAQASFITSTYSASTQDILVTKLRQFYQESDESSLSAVNSKIYQAVANYEQQRQLLTDDSDIQQLNTRLLQDTTLIQLQHRNQTQQVLTISQLEDLRSMYLETQRVRFDEGDIYTRMLGANSDTYNAFLRMLQRGQQATAQDALFLAEYKINALSNLYDESDLTPADQMRVARLMGLRAGSGFLSEQEQAYLAQALMRKSDTGVTGLQSLQTSTAAMTQGVFPLIDQLEQELDGSTEERSEVLRRQLSGLYEYGLNVDKLQDIGLLRAAQSVEETNQAVTSASELLTQLTSPDADQKLLTSPNQESTKQSSILQSDSRLEALGLFVAPTLLALAGSEVKLDERVGMFALDVLQATATLTSRADTLTSQLTGGSTASTAAFNFSSARIRQSLETEGFLVGSIQGFIQEEIFEGLSRAAYTAIDNFTHKLPGGKTKAGNAAATVAAEALSTIVSLGVARATTKQQTRGEEYVPDRVGDILKNVAQQIWQMVEQAQLAMSDPNYEVLDTSENQNLDFEISAVPSQFEQDVQAGLIVIDEEENPISTEFDSSASNQAQLASSF